jgi:hypothetical protein
MNKCCGECVWYTGISTAIGRCSWSAQQSPFWYMTGLPAMVESDEGADCLAFDDDSPAHINPGWSDPLEAQS